MKLLLSVIIAVTPAAALANVYKCEVNGVITYSQIPCSEDAQVTDYSRDEIAAPPQPQSTTSTDEAAATMSRLSESVKKRDMRIAINRLKSDKAKLQSQRDAKMAKLKSSKRYANNNLAGAVWEESLSKEMAAIAAQYDTDVRAIDVEIDRLNDELKRL